MAGSFQVECSMNLKMMIDIARFELEKKGIYISWKQVQMREAATGVQVLGIPDALNIDAVEQTINHQLKLTQEYLIQKKVLDFDLTDEPLPMQHYSFRRHNEQRMPPEIYKQLRFLNLEYYDDEVGCKLLFIQADPTDWGRLGPLWMHLEQSRQLRKMFRLAVVHEVLKKRWK